MKAIGDLSLTFRLLMVAVGTCILAYALALNLPRFAGNRLEANLSWIETAERRTRNKLTEEVFRDAVLHKIIRYDPELDRIVLETRNSWKPTRPTYGNETQRMRATSLSKDTIWSILSRGQGAGPEIVAEIENANRARLALAIKDYGVTQPCPVKKIADCPEASWGLVPLLNETDPSPESGFGTVTSFAGEPDFAVFRAMANTTIARPSGVWSMAAGTDIGGVQFAAHPLASARMVPVRAGFALSIIASSVTLSPDLSRVAHVQRYCAGSLPSSISVRALRCDEDDRRPVIGFKISVPRHNWPESARLRLSPARVPILSKSMRDAIADETAEFDKVRVRVNDSISLFCDGAVCEPQLVARNAVRRLARDYSLEGKSPQEVAWIVDEGKREINPQDPEAVAPVTRQLSRFILQDGPQEFSLTQEARQLAMEPLLGIPEIEAGSFLGLLRNLPAGIEATDLELTFDPDLQAIALDAFRAFLVGPRAPGNLSVVEPGFHPDRRAAFVLLDLENGPKTGAVRAAVGYPFFNDDWSAWDLRAMAAGASGDSPLTPAAWSGLDSRFQPGSSMKILSAISLARTALGQTKGVTPETSKLLLEALLGADPGFFKDGLGFDPKARAHSVQRTSSPADGTKSIRDRGSAPLPVPGPTSQACDRISGSETYGACEALARSSNMYFAALAMFENQRLLPMLYGTQATQAEFTGLGQTMLHLGLGRRLPLVQMGHAGAEAGYFAPVMDAPNIPSAPGLSSTRVATDPDGLHHLNAAINAYGQNTQVTPLAMASVAAGVATGQTVLPFIARSKNTRPPLLRPLLGDSVEARNLLNEIRKGMKAVMAPRGTGYLGFSAYGPEAVALLPRIYAKTGTSEMSESSSVNTHWLVGYVIGANRSPRYAFACVISHTASRFSACPKLTASIMVALDKNGALQ